MPETPPPGAKAETRGALRKARFEFRTKYPKLASIGLAVYGYFLGNGVQVVTTLAAVAAAIFAGWSGYEAHRSRLESSEIAKATLQTQQESVRAQIQVMHLDELPFVSATPLDVVLNRDLPAMKDTEVTILYNISVVGKTPAFNVRYSSVCVADEDKTQPFPPALPEHYELAGGVLFNQDVGTDCSLMLGRVDRSPLVALVTRIQYQDVFQDLHFGMFCFEGSYYKSTKIGFSPCTVPLSQTVR
jgi:hypothetical protein